MASIRLDLPAPVSPVSANRSTPAKSTTVRSRNAVKPSSSRRTGLTASTPCSRRALLDQLVEERRQRLVDGSSRRREVLPEARRRLGGRTRTVTVDVADRLGPVL